MSVRHGQDKRLAIQLIIHQSNQTNILIAWYTVTPYEIDSRSAVACIYVNK